MLNGLFSRQCAPGQPLVRRTMRILRHPPGRPACTLVRQWPSVRSVSSTLLRLYVRMPNIETPEEI